VALSSTEVEYIAPTSAACEAVWLRRIFRDIQDDNKGPTKIFCDDMSTIGMIKSSICHTQTKHIEIRHHFIQGTSRKR